MNGCLALVVAATELIRYNPDVVKRMSATLVEQPPKIAGKVHEFVSECERVLMIRNANEPAWYPATWQWANVLAISPTSPMTAEGEDVRALHTELLQIVKEFMQLGFLVSGANMLETSSGNPVAGVSHVLNDQLPKVSARIARALEAFEKAFGRGDTSMRRLASAAPTSPATLSPEQVMFFHRKLTNLKNDIVEHLAPLIELSRVVKTNPAEVQSRAAEFSQQPPKISAELNQFGLEFDRAFGIVRAAV